MIIFVAYLCYVIGTCVSVVREIENDDQRVLVAVYRISFWPVGLLLYGADRAAVMLALPPGEPPP